MRKLLYVSICDLLYGLFESPRDEDRLECHDFRNPSKAQIERTRHNTRSIIGKNRHRPHVLLCCLWIGTLGSARVSLLPTSPSKIVAGQLEHAHQGAAPPPYISSIPAVASWAVMSLPAHAAIAPRKRSRSREVKDEAKGANHAKSTQPIVGSLRAVPVAISLAAVLATTSNPQNAAAQGSLSPAEAAAIATDAYVYLYPLVSMDITRRQSTNIEAGKEIAKGPMNTFVNVPAFPPADLKVVVRVNFDTLYSVAWLDLTKEPQVVSAPDTSGRFYLLPMLDMWTDVFASPGWRTTGTQAGNFLVTPPGWSGTVPAGMTRIGAPTPYVWVIGRTKTDGPPDYPAVHKIQAGYKVTSLSQWGKAPQPVTVTIDPSVDMKTPPKTQVDNMPAASTSPTRPSSSNCIRLM